MWLEMSWAMRPFLGEMAIPLSTPAKRCQSYADMIAADTRKSSGAASPVACLDHGRECGAAGSQKAPEPPAPRKRRWFYRPPMNQPGWPEAGGGIIGSWAAGKNGGQGGDETSIEESEQSMSWKRTGSADAAGTEKSDCTGSRVEYLWPVSQDKQRCQQGIQ